MGSANLVERRQDDVGPPEQAATPLTSKLESGFRRPVAVQAGASPDQASRNETSDRAEELLLGEDGMVYEADGAALGGVSCPAAP